MIKTNMALDYLKLPGVAFVSFDESEIQRKKKGYTYFYMSSIFHLELIIV